VNNELEPLTTTFVVPVTGEVIELGAPLQVALALETVRKAKRQLEEARGVLEDALRIESERQGTRTLHLGELDAVVSGGEKVEYDVVELADELRAEGLPEERLGELIVATVTYRVDARVARSVAASNRRYAAALERCRRVLPAPWRVSVKTKGDQR
jgi:hypothetical protein